MVSWLDYTSMDDNFHSQMAGHGMPCPYNCHIDKCG